MKIFRFIKKCFFIGSVSPNTLCCISMNDQEFKARPEIINFNINNPIFYPFSIKTS